MKHQIFLSVSKAGQARKKTKKEQQVDYEKFQTYMDGKFSINTIKAHQVYKKYYFKLKFIFLDQISRHYTKV